MGSCANIYTVAIWKFFSVQFRKWKYYEFDFWISKINDEKKIILIELAWILFFRRLPLSRRNYSRLFFFFFNITSTVCLCLQLNSQSHFRSTFTIVNVHLKKKKKWKKIQLPWFYNNRLPVDIHAFNRQQPSMYNCRDFLKIQRKKKKLE